MRKGEARGGEERIVEERRLGLGGGGEDGEWRMGGEGVRALREVVCGDERSNLRGEHGEE